MGIILSAMFLLGVGYALLAENDVDDPVIVQAVVQPSVDGTLSIPSSEPPQEEPRMSPDRVASLLDADIAEIAESHTGVYGIAIFDPNSRIDVRLGAEESFNAASIGKLPALIALYRDAAHGEVDLEDEIVILPEDVQSYGTGVLHTWPVGSALSLRECAYYLINESDNTAWAMLTRHLGQESIQDELAELGAKSTNYWAPNTTTPNDVLLMLEKIADPSFTSPTLSEEMLSFMVDTNQEDRIPAALPSEVRVAHKAGSYEDTYGDAGIIFLEGGGSSEKESYFVVVLAKGTGEYEAHEVIHEVSFAAHRLLAGEV